MPYLVPEFETVHRPESGVFLVRTRTLQQRPCVGRIPIAYVVIPAADYIPSVSDVCDCEDYARADVACEVEYLVPSLPRQAPLRVATTLVRDRALVAVVVFVSHAIQDLVRLRPAHPQEGRAQPPRGGHQRRIPEVGIQNRRVSPRLRIEGPPVEGRRDVLRLDLPEDDGVRRRDGYLHVQVVVGPVVVVVVRSG